MKNNCPFCSPEISEQIIHENNQMLAVYNIAPILPGHSLVIPRKHLESINELSEQELLEFFTFARKTTRILCSAFGSDGFDWSLQESEAAGQSIAHLHLHIIPRMAGDLKKPGDWYPMLEQNRCFIDSPERKSLSREEIKSIVSEIQKYIKPDARN